MRKENFVQEAMKIILNGCPQWQYRGLDASGNDYYFRCDFVAGFFQSNFRWIPGHDCVNSLLQYPPNSVLCLGGGVLEGIQDYVLHNQILLQNSGLIAAEIAIRHKRTWRTWIKQWYTLKTLTNIKLHFHHVTSFLSYPVQKKGDDAS